MKLETKPFDCFIDIQKHFIDKSEGDTEDKEKWMVEGYAVTKDLDFAGDIVTDEAIKGSVNDLKKNKTVLRNHNLNEEIGVVEDSKYEKKGLFVKVMISKTVPDVWKKIQEGVLNKFSVRMKVIEAYKKWDSKAKQLVNYITKMKLVETSLVSVAMNENAKAIRVYVTKAMEDFEKENGKIEVENEDQKAIFADIDNTIEVLKSLGISEEDIAKELLDLDIKDDKTKDNETETEEENNSESEDNDNEENTDNEDQEKDADDKDSDNKPKKRSTSFKNYIRQLIKNILKEEFGSMFEDSKKSIDEEIKNLKEWSDAASKDVEDITQKLINYEDYPQLKEQLTKLQNALQEILNRVDEVEKNLGFQFNDDGDDKEKQKGDWDEIFPNAMK